ncbi:hypothetical protein QQ045_001962 [Rhodiola kirilowii]
MDFEFSVRFILVNLEIRKKKRFVNLEDDDGNECSEDDEMEGGEFEGDDESEMLALDVEKVMSIFKDSESDLVRKKRRVDECDCVVAASSKLVSEVLGHLRNDWEAAFMFFQWVGKRSCFFNGLESSRAAGNSKALSSLSRPFSSSAASYNVDGGSSFIRGAVFRDPSKPIAIEELHCTCRAPKLGKSLSKLKVNPVYMYSMGGMAEYCVVPANGLCVLPHWLPYAESAILGCAVFTAYGAMIHAANVRSGDSIAVIGVGGVGSSCLQLARAFGASDIIAVDIQDDKLEKAKIFGATHTVNSAKEDAVEKIREITGGLGVDIAVEAL